jgi:uncharacterized surface protein with fasciclin (FAS1) repeats
MVLGGTRWHGATQRRASRRGPGTYAGRDPSTSIRSGPTSGVRSVQAGGLEATLQGEGPFTLFAPDNAAFAKLRLGAVDELLADPQGALAAVLQYRVVPGKLMSSDLRDGMTLETVNGQLLKVSVSDEGVVRVNAAKVKVPDIEASNGVIHVINRVLLPKDLPTPSPTP